MPEDLPLMQLLGAMTHHVDLAQEQGLIQNPLRYSLTIFTTMRMAFTDVGWTSKGHRPGIISSTLL